MREFEQSLRQSLWPAVGGIRAQCDALCLHLYSWRLACPLAVC